MNINQLKFCMLFSLAAPPNLPLRWLKHKKNSADVSRIDQYDFKFPKYQVNVFWAKDMWPQVNCCYTGWGWNGLATTRNTNGHS